MVQKAAQDNFLGLAPSGWLLAGAYCGGEDRATAALAQSHRAASLARSRRPKPQAQLPPQPQRCPDGDGVDLISGLPHDLLREILRRLRCARDAARTSVLSRRWRGLWRHLPELSFRGVSAKALPDALAQVARPELSLLDIYVRSSSFSVVGIASLLRTAADLAPVDLVVNVELYEMFNISIPFELQLPCFHRAKLITLELEHVGGLCWNLWATGGEFPVLEMLSLVGCPVSLTDLISRAPRLRSLRVRHSSEYHDEIQVHSTRIEELLLDCKGLLGGIDVLAPALKTLTLSATRMRSIHGVAPVLKMFALRANMVFIDSSISLSAPTVENLSLNCEFATCMLHQVWCMTHLKLGMKEDDYVLSLHLQIEPPMEHPHKLQEIVPLPIISVVELYLHPHGYACGPHGHAYGPMVLTLLSIFIDVQRLKLVIRDKFYEACPPNCACNEPEDWRSQSVSLMALEVVEIESFGGTSHEIDLLKLLFRCAPLMKQVTVKPHPNTLPSIRACKEICNLFKENPSVKCYAYDSCGKKVVYARSTYASRCRWS